MPLYKLDPPPGVYRNGTRYAAAGRWYDAQLVRFLDGAKLPVGGWQKLQDAGADLAIRSTGVLRLTGLPLNTETVTLDTKVYTFQTTLTNVDGNVLVGATASDSIDNLVAAITLGAGAGTLYATATTLHATVTAIAGENDTMYVTAKSDGDQLLATTETLTNGSFASTTLVANRPRALDAWWDDNGTTIYLAIGTNAKCYTFSLGGMTDRTPDGLVTGGIDSVFSVGPYGAGNYGAGSYGVGDTSQGTIVEPGAWSLDTFGDFLVGVLTSDGTLWKWDPASDTYLVGMGGAATATLTVTDNPANTETVTIDGKVYTFQTTLTDVDGNV